MQWSVTCIDVKATYQQQVPVVDHWVVQISLPLHCQGSIHIKRCHRPAAVLTVVSIYWNRPTLNWKQYMVPTTVERETYKISPHIILVLVLEGRVLDTSLLTSAVKWNTCISRWFTVCSGVLQGGVLSPVVFTVLLTYVMCIYLLMNLEYPVLVAI